MLADVGRIIDFAPSLDAFGAVPIEPSLAGFATAPAGAKIASRWIKDSFGRFAAFGAHGIQTGQWVNNSVPAFASTRPSPRQRRHVLLGETLAPLDEKGGDWPDVAIIESAPAGVAALAFDKAASGFVVEAWPLTFSAGRGSVKIGADSFIFRHGWFLVDASPQRVKASNFAPASCKRS